MRNINEVDMKAHRFVTIFVLCCAFFATAREYSGVVVSKTSKNPIEGVLVSVGHSEFYTRTDKNGNFSITDPTPDPEPTPEPPTAMSKVKLQNARWNFQGRTLDLRAIPGVNSVSIYTTNGKRVFNGQVPSSRIVSLPSMAMGIYMLELHGEYGIIERSSTKLSKDAVDSERLIFRHDDYLPKDMDMTSSNTDMNVELKPDERSTVFDKSKVHEYRLTIAQNDLNYMDSDGWREEFKPAELKYNGTAVSGKIGIRYKGSNYTLIQKCFGYTGWGDPPSNWKSSGNKCPKVSYKLKFTEYDKETRLHGLKKVNLHAFAADEVKDSTKMHEMLAYELYRDMGIPAPRTSYADVYINDKFVGLFVAVEEIDGRFTKSRWPEFGDGNLYKEKWPKSGNERDYINGLKTNNDPGDNPSAKKMVEYYNAINGSNESNFEQRVSPYMDIDYFLRYLAVDVAIKNWDGIRALYSGTSHNYFFYEEEKEVSNGKIWIVPWDMDQALKPKDRYFEGQRALPQWNVPTTSCNAQNVDGQQLVPPNCEKLFKLTAAVFANKDNKNNRYVQFGDILLKDFFVSERLNEKIDKYSNLISNSVQQDPNIDYNAWTSEITRFKNNYLPNNISQFRSYLHP
jgi:hypothetical protein